MGNLKVTIASRDSKAIKKIYRNHLPSDFNPIAMVRLYILRPSKPAIYGLMIVGCNKLEMVETGSHIIFKSSPRFFLVNGNMLHHEHLYYSQLLSVSSMIMDMYGPSTSYSHANFNEIKVSSRSLDMRVPVQRL